MTHEERCNAILRELWAEGRQYRSLMEQLEDRTTTREDFRTYCEEQDRKSHAERMEEIERRRDTVLAECNPNLPTYEAK